METMTSASSPPKKIDRKNRISVVGTALSSVTIVLERKAISIWSSLSLAHGRSRHAAIGLALGAVKDAVRQAGEDQVESAADNVEQEILSGRTGRDLAR